MLMKSSDSRIDKQILWAAINKFQDIKSLSEAKFDWESVLDKAEYVPVAYTSSMVRYQTAYWVDSVTVYHDLSMVIYYNEKPVAVWPLCIRYTSLWECGSNEGQVVPPLFISGISEKMHKKIIDGCISILESICEIIQQKFWQGTELSLNKGISLWHRRLLEAGALLHVSHESYVDLSLGLDEIRANIRKSYKSLLTMGKKLWDIEVLDKVSNSVFAEYRELHFQAAGRSTRSIRTWDLQEQDINEGNAFLVTLRNSDQQMVGGGLFYTSKTEGLYAVGAYNRDLFQYPLGHVVQMAAIEHMKNLGLQWYKIGSRPYITDNPTPSEKEIKIGYFKEGFATHIFLKMHMRCNLHK